MRILIDENIPLRTVEALRAAGHDVLSLHEFKSKGMSDTEIWSLAQKEQRTLVTTDKGFARLRAENHYGLLIVRLKQPDAKKIHNRVLAALTEFPGEQWPGLLVIMRDATRGLWRRKS